MRHASSGHVMPRRLFMRRSSMAHHTVGDQGCYCQGRTGQQTRMYQYTDSCSLIRPRSVNPRHQCMPCARLRSYRCLCLCGNQSCAARCPPAPSALRWLCTAVLPTLSRVAHTQQAYLVAHGLRAAACSECPMYAPGLQIPAGMFSSLIRRCQCQAAIYRKGRRASET